MKLLNQSLLGAFMLFSSISYCQYNTVWTYSTLNTGSAGYVGIGTKNNSGTTNTPLPAFNLHLHGTSDYIFNDASSGMAQIDSTNGFLSGHTNNFQTKALINYGKTTRFGLTNTTTGMTETDGTVLQMSGNDFTLYNRESGILSIKALGTGVFFSGINGRTWFGSQANTNPTSSRYAEVNVFSAENGLYIENQVSGKYALSLYGPNALDNAFQVVNTDGTIKRFSIQNSGNTELYTSSTLATDKVFLIKNSTQKLLQLTNDGILRSREIIVDLTAWPDYVFEENYKLMPLSELREYIVTNNHLPNIPSEEEMIKEGLNVAESNKLLMEKIEELTLYIIQLNEEVNLLKEQNQKVNK